MRIQLELSTSAVALIAAVMGCGGAGHAPVAESVSPATGADVTCTATAKGIDVSAWRQVEGGGFTFCVPRDWRGSGHQWRHGASSITWGVGARTPKIGTAEVKVTPAQLEEIVATGRPPDSDGWHTTEDIGGREAEIWRNRMGRDYATGAEWSSPDVWFTGTAKTAAAADLQLAIFRTVTFTTK